MKYLSNGGDEIHRVSVSMLRRLLRREVIAQRIVLAVGVASLLTLTAMTILTVVQPSWATGCSCFLLVWLVLLLTIPFAGYVNRYDPEETRLQLWHSLAQYGAPMELIDQIDADLKACPHSVILGPRPTGFRGQSCLLMTQAWLLCFQANWFLFIPLREIAWIYKRIEAGSSLGISVRFEVQVAIVLVNGNLHVLPLGSEADIDHVLRSFAKRHPSELFGFMGEWLQLVENSTNAKTSLRQCLEKRRRQFAGLSAENQHDWIAERKYEAMRFLRRIDSSMSDADHDM